jgi:hypothetical protein
MNEVLLKQKWGIETKRNTQISEKKKIVINTATELIN